jgi:hypothetical protein
MLHPKFAIYLVVPFIVNKTCFDKKSLKEPIDIVFSACALMRYWACLYFKETQVMIKASTVSKQRCVVWLLKRKVQPAAL